MMVSNAFAWHHIENSWNIVQEVLEQELDLCGTNTSEAVLNQTYFSEATKKHLTPGWEGNAI